ncbi:MAG TPA: sigma-54 dependent transcriptional regulator [Methylomirabilota bacterium]|jgi:DNA-binding NtrC family response regulator|nr:sigma-54 dependent transcriptional regulator [Methylomirabilota bacterium]
MAERSKVLVVEDEERIRTLFEDALSLWGYHVTTASTGAEAIELIQGQLFDTVLCDIRMPEMDGLTILREIKRHDPSIEVVMITGYPAVATAVEALKLGAYDYLAKPVSLDELHHLMDRLMERRFLRREVSSLRSRLGVELPLKEMVGRSPRMQRVRDVVAKVATTDSPVLIEGESGTGKDLVAAGIHRLSARGKGPFIPVNCGAVPTELLESEFFGHVRGAFSGAVADHLGLFRSAHGGTLFLDEVTELPPALQVKLLRVLEEKEIRPVGSAKSHPVDVRVIAATNRNLEQALRDGVLRQDLFYRLNVVRLAMPPLRDRKEDIPALASYFLRQLNERFGRDVTGVSSEAMAALVAHDFPGNVRELENLLERAYALGARGEIMLADLPALAPTIQSPPSGRELPNLAEVERELILRALRLHGNDKERAARALGISRRTLYRRLKEYGL